MSTISNDICPNSFYFVYFKEWEISYVNMIYNMVAINKELNRLWLIEILKDSCNFLHIRPSNKKADVIKISVPLKETSTLVNSLERFHSLTPDIVLYRPLILYCTDPWYCIVTTPDIVLYRSLILYCTYHWYCIVQIPDIVLYRPLILYCTDPWYCIVQTPDIVLYRSLILYCTYPWYCIVHVYVIIHWPLILYCTCLCYHSLTSDIVLYMFILSFTDPWYCIVHVYVIIH